MPVSPSDRSGIWRAGRVLGLLNNKTYMGIHEYGKRSKKREPIKRAAPAIVSEDTWQKAQKTLSSNFLFGKRSARNKYLLRGLVKCGLCGRTYIGSIGVPHEGKVEFYYKGNGAHSPAVYLPGERCRSKAIRGDLLEQQVWSDIETFLRNPEPVLEQLHTRLEGDVKGTENIQKQVVRLEGLLEQKTTERSRLLSLYRRGRLSDSELDAQMDEIAKEKAALETQVSELRGRMRGQDSIAATVSSAQELLAVLRKRLDAPISWEVKRRIVEVLVAGIRIDTFEDCGVKQAKTTVTYRFSQPEQAMALMLSESYSGGGRVVRIPTELNTIGDHIRRRRLEQKMLQKELGELIGLTENSVNNWEANTSTPEVRYMPAIIEFLGYNPLAPANTVAEKLVRQRTTQGLTQKQAAELLAIDQGTLARWERGEREPADKFLERVKQFLEHDQPTKQNAA